MQSSITFLGWDQQNVSANAIAVRKRQQGLPKKKKKKKKKRKKTTLRIYLIYVFKN